MKSKFGILLALTCGVALVACSGGGGNNNNKTSSNDDNSTVGKGGEDNNNVGDNDTEEEESNESFESAIISQPIALPTEPVTYYTNRYYGHGYSYTIDPIQGTLTRVSLGVEDPEDAVLTASYDAKTGEYVYEVCDDVYVICRGSIEKLGIAEGGGLATITSWGSVWGVDLTPEENMPQSGAPVEYNGQFVFFASDSHFADLSDDWEVRWEGDAVTSVDFDRGVLNAQFTGTSPNDDQLVSSLHNARIDGSSFEGGIFSIDNAEYGLGADHYIETWSGGNFYGSEAQELGGRLTVTVAGESGLDGVWNGKAE